MPADEFPALDETFACEVLRTCGRDIDRLTREHLREVDTLPLVRADRRNRRHELADVIVTSGLMAKKLKPAALKKLLDE